MVESPCGVIEGNSVAHRDWDNNHEHDRRRRRRRTSQPAAATIAKPQADGSGTAVTPGRPPPSATPAAEHDAGERRALELDRVVDHAVVGDVDDAVVIQVAVHVPVGAGELDPVVDRRRSPPRRSSPSRFMSPAYVYIAIVSRRSRSGPGTARSRPGSMNSTRSAVATRDRRRVRQRPGVRAGVLLRRRQAGHGPTRRSCTRAGPSPCTPSYVPTPGSPVNVPIGVSVTSLLSLRSIRPSPVIVSGRRLAARGCCAPPQHLQRAAGDGDAAGGRQVACRARACRR